MRIGTYSIKGRFHQQPAEIRRRLFNYARWLEAGEVITSIAAAVTPVTATPLVVDTLLIDPDGTRIAYNVQGGQEGCDYTITFTAGTSVGQSREDEVLVGIKEIQSG